MAAARVPDRASVLLCLLWACVLAGWPSTCTVVDKEIAVLQLLSLNYGQLTLPCLRTTHQLAEARVTPEMLMYRSPTRAVDIFEDGLVSVEDFQFQDSSVHKLTRLVSSRLLDCSTPCGVFQYARAPVWV